MGSPWREWAKDAPSELLQDFTNRSGNAMAALRLEYHPFITPHDHSYFEMKRRMTEAFNEICQEIQEQHDA